MITDALKRFIQVKIGRTEIREGVKGTAALGVGLILYRALSAWECWPLPFLPEAESVVVSSAVVEYIRRAIFKQF